MHRCASARSPSKRSHTRKFFSCQRSVLGSGGRPRAMSAHVPVHLRVSRRRHGTGGDPSSERCDDDDTVESPREVACWFSFYFSLHSFLRGWWGWQGSNLQLSETPGLQSGGDSNFPINPLELPQIARKSRPQFPGTAQRGTRIGNRPRWHHPDRRSWRSGSRRAHSRTLGSGKVPTSLVRYSLYVHFLTTCLAQLAAVADPASLRT